MDATLFELRTEKKEPARWAAGSNCEVLHLTGEKFALTLASVRSAVITRMGDTFGIADRA